MKASALRVVALLATCGALLARAGDARADIGPPPQCPAGLSPSYWEGHYCAPIACSTDGDCGAQKCVERAVCLHARERSNLPNTDKQFEYVGECGASPTCTDGTCITKKFCTTPGATVPGVDEPAGGKKGCGCAVPGGKLGTTLCALTVATGIGLLLARRRGRPGK